MHTFLLAPTSARVGLTSTSLGLVRALSRAGLSVGFFKAVAQHHSSDDGPERSTGLMKLTHHIDAPEPLALVDVERYIAEHNLDDLLEALVTRFHSAAHDHDVVIIEGLVPNQQTSYATRVNVALASSLNAEAIIVTAPDDESAEVLADRIALHVQQFGGPDQAVIVGAVVNKLPSADYVDALKGASPLFQRDDFRLIGTIPWDESLNNPRVADVMALMQASALSIGDASRRRVKKTVLCARAMPNTVALLQPGVLVVTPGDRDDILVASCLAAMNGVPLAGLLLCTDFQPDARVLALCQPAIDAGLPVFTVASGSYDTARALAKMNPEIPLDDAERAEAITEFMASHLDHQWLQARCGQAPVPRMTPAAFRYQLVTRAKAAKKRIVLPEGAEPRTVQAAAICQARGIADCVLLAKPAEVREVARTQGVTLPDALTIIDPDSVREDYVAAMVKLRAHKGLNAPMALAQLEDTVVLGTMMLAEGEVDGLVSGAVHTTANTIRPALQLIKTAPGYNIVSSVFFMLLPQQVLVYGDCAVNPDPNAQQLADIALQSAASAQAFGIPARVALLSYSTGDSGSGDDVEKVREATRLAQAARPDLALDGPLQYDAAAIASVGQQKAPNSPVAGQATVFVFPDLNTGNTTYKAVQRSANCVSVGPMLQGLNKPVNDLSRGALVDDIVFTIALTAIQAAS
ncbi:phosphotransacetylase [Paraperlucidibaca baekdonensis]|uniref:Phosphate acetyltransferase n=1 Tax=Paraperlucidibaca baekdonensis TaxID=748120 RepID=A0A3E0H6D3_9GAMM|nr:phosphate acetyltransferase [Paraperlucidibaca baekdonensis]REH38945.1 phosphotransacetylase [Paraperlucidibaca baekdonensis]